MGFLKRTTARRNQVRKNITGEKFLQLSQLANTDNMISAALWLCFVISTIAILSFEPIAGKNYRQLIPLTIITVMISLALAFYVCNYQKRILTNHARASALVGMFVVLLLATKIGNLLPNKTPWATGTAVGVSIILSIAYDRRFAIGMSIFYCILACFAAGLKTNFNLFLTMLAGVFTCCICLKEIRTRMKLLEVTALAASIVFLASLVLSFLSQTINIADSFSNAGFHAVATFIVGLLIQSLLPLIENIFRISTSMTLLDYSDANQPLLKRLAMEAPGTFSHSLLVGSVAEAAAELIHRNGLLCRVGAYYHDIGKINKPTYFVENEEGLASKHKELSPTMSQLIIVGHVKDGIELAREYKLPMVLRQFIETHHGTTLVEYFYNEAKKKHVQTQTPLSESEFRYTGPKPLTKEAAIVMLADAAESTVRSLADVSTTKIEAVVHNIAMKRLQDGQFDECDISLRELSRIETSMSKSLAAHYHGRVAYPAKTVKPQESNNFSLQQDSD